MVVEPCDAFVADDAVLAAWWPWQVTRAADAGLVELRGGGEAATHAAASKHGARSQ